MKIIATRISAALVCTFALLGSAVAQSRVEIVSPLSGDYYDAKDLALIVECSESRGNILGLQDELKARRNVDKQDVRISFNGKLGELVGQIIIAYDRENGRATSIFRSSAISTATSRKLTGSDQEVYFDTTDLKQRHLDAMAAVVEIIRVMASDSHASQVDKSAPRIAQLLGISLRDSQKLLSVEQDVGEAASRKRGLREQVAMSVAHAAQIAGEEFSFRVVNLPLAKVALPATPLSVKHRVWTDATGKYRVEAELLESRDGIVLLKRKDNSKAIEIPFRRLSQSDQDYLRQIAKESAGTKEAIPQSQR